MVVAGLVLTEAVVMFTEVVVAVVIVAVLVETESSFAHLQAPASLSASAFLFSYANIKKSNKGESKAGNNASSGFVTACMTINIKTTTLRAEGKIPVHTRKMSNSKY